MNKIKKITLIISICITATASLLVAVTPDIVSAEDPATPPASSTTPPAATTPAAPTSSSGLTAASTPADCSQHFLTFPTWFRGLAAVRETAPGSSVYECAILSPDDVGGLSNFIWHIALNGIEIGLQLVVYLTIFFIIWGGYQFLISQGVPEATAKARKTILNAVIGLVISIVAIAAVNLIFGIIK
jgi:hypothetical protein